MKSKTIILSPLENENGRAILTLYLEDDLLKCKLRLYSMPKLTPACKLGVYHQNEVYTSNLIEKNGQYESSLVGDFNMLTDFYCAIINTQNNNQVLLAGGTYAGFYFNDSSVFNNEQPTAQEQNEPQEDQTTPTCETCNKCANCKYKEYFYSNSNTLNLEAPQPEIKTTQTEIPQPAKENEILEPNAPEVAKTPSAQPTIKSSLIPQFKYVFETYPQDETLNNLVENSKFVKINENANQYSIGAVYENDQIKYICYAVKGDYNTPPPAELGEHHQWLPLDTEDPLSEGYFLVFQDANDLKILEL